MAFSIANLLAAIIILLLGIALGSFAGRFTRRTIITLDLKKYFKFKIDEIGSRIVTWFIYVLAAIISLINLGIATPVLYAIIIILLALVAGAIFLVLKDLIPNTVAGATLQGRNLKKGQKIKFGEISGKVEEFTTTETTIRSGNDLIHVPNSLLAKSVLHIKEASKKSKKKSKK